MPRVLILLSQTDFDPTEVAVPWSAWNHAGHKVSFATEKGMAATCDPVTLTGDGLSMLARSLKARSENVALYHAMESSSAFTSPICWSEVDVARFDAFHFPGGHAPGMRPYLESSKVQKIAIDAFAAKRPVSAICHGVVPLARAGLLAGRRTTALTAVMEGFAIALTKGRLGDHYRTYPQSVEAEVKAALSNPSDFETGPLLPRYASETNRSAGFIVRDGHYVSARWPGDAWTLADEMLKML